MFRVRTQPVRSLAVIIVLALPLLGQAVIATRSGIVHFFEGNVYLGGQLLEFHPGSFPSIPQGAELRTAEGRAEVLLTPGAFIRIGERSAIRMVANQLSDTRVELLAGSAIVNSAEQNSGTSVTLVFKNWRLTFPQPGIYRIDSDPPHLRVLQGQAQISSGTDQAAILVGRGMDLPFASVLVPKPSTNPPNDALSSWAEGRQQSISADNAIAANIQDPASITATDSGFDTFTNFPMLGLPPPSTTSSSAYGYSDAVQSGFNSVYLPGYTYMPVLIGLLPVGVLTPGRIRPHPGIVPPRVPSPLPAILPPHLPSPAGVVVPVPHTPAPHPANPMPAHPGLGIGVHGGVHR